MKFCINPLIQQLVHGPFWAAAPKETIFCRTQGDFCLFRLFVRAFVCASPPPPTISISHIIWWEVYVFSFFINVSHYLIGIQYCFITFQFPMLFNGNSTFSFIALSIFHAFPFFFYYTIVILITVIIITAVFVLHLWPSLILSLCCHHYCDSNYHYFHNICLHYCPWNQ